MGYLAMHYVYILQCADGTYYVGSTSNVEARVTEHNEGVLGACHTLHRRPVTLVYTEPFATVIDARRREDQLKGWSHDKKSALIAGDVETLKALSKRRRA